ncbi:hypothetical protein LXL04_019536 [Taraxacum kok-saghyz]
MLHRAQHVPYYIRWKKRAYKRTLSPLSGHNFSAIPLFPALALFPLIAVWSFKICLLHEDLQCLPNISRPAPQARVVYAKDGRLPSRGVTVEKKHLVQYHGATKTLEEDTMDASIGLMKMRIVGTLTGMIYDGVSEWYKQVLNEIKPKKKPRIPEFVNPRLIFLVKVMIGLLLLLVLDYLLWRL